jgi:hypothetical protein
MRPRLRDTIATVRKSSAFCSASGARIPCLAKRVAIPKPIPLVDPVSNGVLGFMIALL